jgi:hypothetical protein
MKIPACLCAVSLVLAGCATQGDANVAQAECKVAPITTASLSPYGGKAKPVSPLEQRYAEMQLASTQYRRDNLARNGLAPNLVEDALRSCD